MKYGDTKYASFVRRGGAFVKSMTLNWLVCVKDLYIRTP